MPGIPFEKVIEPIETSSFPIDAIFQLGVRTPKFERGSLPLDLKVAERDEKNFAPK